MRRLAVLAVALVVLAAPSRAGAEPPVSCGDAFDQSQVRRDDGKLLDARQLLRVCASRECLPTQQKLCTEWLADVDARMPSFVVSARDSTGAELVDVKVLMDGVPVATRIDGRAFDVDPGPHSFVFELADGTRAQTTAVASEHGKGKVVSVTFGQPPPPAPAPPSTSAPPPAPPEPPPDTEEQHGFSWSELSRHMVGGVMLGGLLQANQTGNQLQRRCGDVGTTCTIDPEKGGGVYGFFGFAWKYIGVDLLLGGSGDGSLPSATSPSSNGQWSIFRVGGLEAIRVAASVETEIVRAKLALGVGLSERVVGISGYSTTSYISGLGLLDASLSVRVSPAIAIMVGCTGVWEDAGQDAVIVVPFSRTPFYLFSGSQILVQPYLGLQFGP